MVVNPENKIFSLKVFLPFTYFSLIYNFNGVKQENK